jgi:hypothetical protein
LGLMCACQRRAVNRRVRTLVQNGQIAQSVEQRIENPRVGGSIPPLATIFFF